MDIIRMQDPVVLLLQQALELLSSKPAPISINYEEITKAAVKMVKEEKEKIYPRVLVTQNEAIEKYGKSVIKALVKRGHLQQYKFDTREACDSEGNVITKAKGVIYYRVAEIEDSIENGNILKGTRRNII